MRILGMMVMMMFFAVGAASAVMKSPRSASITTRMTVTFAAGVPGAGGCRENSRSGRWNGASIAG